MLIEVVEPGALVETDLCIVGGGAAGLSIAHLFEGSGLAVTVLEGGGRSYTESSQSLYIGAEAGTFLPPRSFYLTSSRLRYLGGSSNHWQGWCRPLDSLDFEQRPWVDESGWPISESELEPFYRRAVSLVQVSPFNYRPIERETERQPFLFPESSGIETTFFHVSPPTRFGTVYAPELEASRDCRLHLNASVTEILTSESGLRVESLRVAGGDAQHYQVRAGAYVLAAGAIENARLLLASRRHEAVGVGNRYDRVGRYFMDHPLMSAGLLAIPRRRRSMGVYKATRARSRGHLVRGVLRLSDRLQREEQLLNAVMILRALEPHEPTDLARAVKTMAEETSGTDRASSRKEPSYYAQVHITGEQSPNPDSRVSLSEETDALGVPRVSLDWKLNAQDAASMRRSAELLALRLGAALLGRSQLTIDPTNPWEGARGSNHHMGTTRMDPDPRRGVVDTDCAVHGVAGLYVAGSSVFPTVGASNPTLTLLALAVRLRDHLEEVLR